ncbi:MAG: polymer-forming cytoskeletal protein [Hydrogenophaga sp.]|uniref:polymer-forming cytoskeletal protein n=1 Tax=Hydrogenophaga sp. TaxID=1904254 RepID=UPI002610CCE0|nr:polymer-forming cytoskeletal protein [Hydrogenophaga sp.]MDM7944103.1 polymer-forming cytoskeletal protein [Hydrogenophaga sp.]
MKATLLLVLGLSVAGAFAQPVEIERNVQAFGSSVRTDATVKGDFSAAGGRVVVDHPVNDDALLLGGTVDVRAPVGDDLRAAGGDISVESSVGGDLMAAGGNVRLTGTAQVGGRAELAAGDVRVDGRVNGSLKVRARRLVLNGPVGGSVQADVGQLELGPQARVAGGVRHSASTLAQDPAAVVSGPLQRVESLFDEDTRRGRSGRHPMHEDGWPALSGWWLLVPLSMGLLGVLALAGAVLFVFSRFAGQAAHRIETEPWRALGLGAVLLLALPVLALLLFFTVLGIPLGLLVLALYPPLLLLGWLIGALFAARWLSLHVWPSEAKGAVVPYGWMAVAVIALLVLGAMPVVGPLLVTATMAAGLGACVLEWRRRLASRPEGAP